MAEQTPRKTYPSDLRDAQWEIIAPLLPPEKPRGAPREVDLREVVNTLLYMTRTGCQWRFIPHDLLPKSTVWDYFKAWKGDGTLQRVLDALRRRVRREAGREEEPSAGSIDTQSVKTHHQGADSDVDGGKKVKGRKRHITVDTMGLLLAVSVTAASLHDGRSAPAVLGKLDARTESRLEVLWGDSKYNTQPLRDWLAANGKRYRIEVVSKPEGTPFRILPKRWVVERTFAWLGYSRRLSKDYERTTSSSEAWIMLSASHLMAKRLAPNERTNADNPEFKYPKRPAALA